MAGGLGRIEPPDWEHVEKYALADAPPDLELPPTPVVWGINWYSKFDYPQQDPVTGLWWAAKPNDHLGNIRGGHAICSPAGGQTDPLSWQSFYNQGSTGRCVGFSLSRMMSLENRVRYDAGKFYLEVTYNDEWPENDGDVMFGTSVRAGGNVLVNKGEIRFKTQLWNTLDGISTYRWATSAEEVHTVLQSPKADRLGAIPWLNSWGTAYPHVVWVPDNIADRLLSEYGECLVPTDR